MPTLHLSPEEYQELSKLQVNHQDEVLNRDRHVKERLAEQNRYEQALSYREEMNIGPEDETGWEGNHGLKTIESRKGYIHDLSNRILISETEKLPKLRKAVDDFIKKHLVVETVPAPEAVVEDEEEPSVPNVCCPGGVEKEESSSDSESESEDEDEDEEDDSTEKPVVNEPAVDEPVVDKNWKWEKSVQPCDSLWSGKDPKKEWDYVGVCEWTGTYDEYGWPQDTDWGHESKYGNKRFGKGRLGHM